MQLKALTCAKRTACEIVCAMLGAAILSPPVRAQAATGAAASSSAPLAKESDAEFYAAANEVLGVMSKILDLPVKKPLKESIKSKAQIRAFLVAQQKKGETAKEQYADQRTMEAFGFIPKGFPLNTFLLNVLTEQVAGLYDPAKKQFFIADWISPVEQKPVMAHELTHALDDEYFNLRKWQKGAKSNDDDALACDAVVEGSALAAMLDYSFLDLHTNVRSMPDIAPFIESSVAGEMDKDPELGKAPPYIRDVLLFPYLAGAEFTQRVLKANSGWGDFKKVFENPPASTQQIMQPETYFNHTEPREVKLPNVKEALPHGYRKLDENIVGEFGLREILRQFATRDEAEEIPPLWAGDRYAVWENKKTKKTVLVVLMEMDNAPDVARFAKVYWAALMKKHNEKDAGAVPWIAGAAEFAAADDVYMRCQNDACLSVEGAGRPVFEKMIRELHWPGVKLSETRGKGKAPSSVENLSAGKP